MRAPQVVLAAEVRRLTHQDLLHGGWHGLTCSSAIFDPSYAPKVTLVPQLQAMGLGGANPEELLSGCTVQMVLISCG